MHCSSSRSSDSEPEAEEADAGWAMQDIWKILEDVANYASVFRPYAGASKPPRRTSGSSNPRLPQ